MPDRTSLVSFACLTVAGLYAASLGVWSLFHPGWNPVRVETGWIVFGFLVLFVLAGQMFTQPTGVDGEANGRSLPMSWLLLVLCAGGLIYYRAITLGFLSDDFEIVSLPAGTTGWVNGDSAVWRPLPIAVFWFANRFLGDYAAFVLHLLNIGLHCGCSWLVWRLANALAVPRVASVLAMLLFLTFPASVEAVAWCAGLQDIVATTAILLFTLLVLEDRPLAAVLSVFALGLLSKESAVVSPVLAALLYWASPKRRPAAKSTVMALATATLIAGLFSWWRLRTAGPTFAASPSRYLMKKVTSNVFSTLALPWTLADLHYGPALGVYIAALVTLAGISMAFLVGRPQRARVLFSALIWPVVAILPAYSIFFVAANLEGGRLLYASAAGWSIALAASASTFAGFPQRFMRAAIALVVVLWGITVYGHVLLWNQASILRDRVLESAETLPLETCATTGFTGLPDNFTGAYVFRNGFHEALRRRRRDFIEGPSGCRFIWTGTRFERQD